MNQHRTGLGDDEPLVVSPLRAAFLLDVGKTTIHQLIKLKQLETYLEGRSRKITLRSINALITKRLAAAESQVAIAGASPRTRTHSSTGDGRQLGFSFLIPLAAPTPPTAAVRVRTRLRRKTAGFQYVARTFEQTMLHVNQKIGPDDLIRW